MPFNLRHRVERNAPEDRGALRRGVAVVHRLGQFDFGDARDALEKVVPQGKVGRCSRGLGQSIRADVHGRDASDVHECLPPDLRYLCRNDEGARGGKISAEGELNTEECRNLNSFKILRKREIVQTTLHKSGVADGREPGARFKDNRGHRGGRSSIPKSLSSKGFNISRDRQGSRYEEMASKSVFTDAPQGGGQSDLGYHTTPVENTLRGGGGGDDRSV